MTIARIEKGQVVEQRDDIALSDVPAHKRSQWRTVVGDPPSYDPKTEILTSYSVGEDSVVKLWSITKRMSTTPVDFGSSLADPATDTLDMIFDGFCVGIAYPGSVRASATWTGLNEDVDGSFNGLPTRNFFAASINSAGQISVAPSCTYSSSNSNNRVGVFAAFR